MSISATWDGVRYVCTPVTEEPVPEPTPEPERFYPLVAYSQNDPEWRSLVYAGGTTFGAAGCYVVALASQISTAYSERIEPPEVANRLRAAGCFSGNLLSKTANISAAFERLFWMGAQHYRDVPADMAYIARQLETHGSVIAEVAFNPRSSVYWVDAAGAHWNQHFVLIVGLTGDDATAMDPWTGEIGPLTESRYFKADWPKRASRVITGVRVFGVRP